MKKIEVDGWIPSYLDKYGFGDPITGMFEFEVYPELEMAKIKLRGIAAPLKAHVTIIPESERYCEWWWDKDDYCYLTGCEYEDDNRDCHYKYCTYCGREIKEKNNEHP